MPWKITDHRQRLNFITAALAPGINFRDLCRQFAISAPTGYKWLARFKSGGTDGLHELSRKPQSNPRKFRSPWHNEIIALRKKHPSWGVKKLRIHLYLHHLQASKLPSLRTLGRWLKTADLIAPARPRSRPGPQVEQPALTKSSVANDVWTVDFKGWFRTADGRRCDPLTIRDLASRYVLCSTIVAEQSDDCARKVMTALFKRTGLPLVIRVDNGSPFASKGALNLSRLSVWWLRLGIRVEFTRRGKPQDNGAHEQMHRILKAETASPPAANPRAQQRRLDRWREQYNTLRPHEALGGLVPAARYSCSIRHFHTGVPLSYPLTWQTRRVHSNGWIKFQGILRFIGRAFVHQLVGLQCAPDQTWNVHMGTLLIGILHQSDGNQSMRYTMFRKPPKWPKITTQSLSVKDVMA